MNSNAVQNQSRLSQIRWQEIVAPYATPNARRSLWQAVHTIGAYLIAWYLMYRSMEISYVLTLLLAVLTAGMAMRTFIILHDCGHGSFFKSQKLNDWIGSICGVLTFTAYLRWRHDHAIHHATSGDLDRRGTGDVPTLTTREYRAMPWWGRTGYRLLRHPLILFPVLMPLSFIFMERVYFGKGGRRERLSVIYTDLALLAIALGASFTIGLQQYIMVQLPIVIISSMIGGWLFYVQHQFEDTYWRNHPEWDYLRASLEGSSYYKVGRGTSTFDGLSIAWAVVEYINEKIKARTIFATHYHELTGLAALYDKVLNFQVAVKRWQDEIIFLHKIVPGGCDDSYGIEVARLAGVPKRVIGRARDLLKLLESGKFSQSELARGVHKNINQHSLFEKTTSEVEEELRRLDINSVTPLDAIRILSKLKEMLDGR